MKRRDDHSQDRGSKPANAENIVKRNSMDLTVTLNCEYLIVLMNRFRTCTEITDSDILSHFLVDSLSIIGVTCSVSDKPRAVNFFVVIVFIHLF